MRFNVGSEHSLHLSKNRLTTTFDIHQFQSNNDILLTKCWWYLVVQTSFILNCLICVEIHTLHTRFTLPSGRFCTTVILGYSPGSIFCRKVTNPNQTHVCFIDSRGMQLEVCPGFWVNISTLTVIFPKNSFFSLLPKTASPAAPNLLIPNQTHGTPMSPFALLLRNFLGSQVTQHHN